MARRPTGLQEIWAVEDRLTLGWRVVHLGRTVAGQPESCCQLVVTLDPLRLPRGRSSSRWPVLRCSAGTGVGGVAAAGQLSVTPGRQGQTSAAVFLNQLLRASRSCCIWPCRFRRALACCSTPTRWCPGPLSRAFVRWETVPRWWPRPSGHDNGPYPALRAALLDDADLLAMPDKAGLTPLQTCTTSLLAAYRQRVQWSVIPAAHVQAPVRLSPFQACRRGAARGCLRQWQAGRGLPRQPWLMAMPSRSMTSVAVHGASLPPALELVRALKLQGARHEALVRDSHAGYSTAGLPALLAMLALLQGFLSHRPGPDAALHDQRPAWHARSPTPRNFRSLPATWRHCRGLVEGGRMSDPHVLAMSVWTPMTARLLVAAGPVMKPAPGRAGTRPSGADRPASVRAGRGARHGAGGFRRVR